MVRKLTSRPLVLVLVAMALVLAYIPALAQQDGGDWLTTSDRGMVGISSPAAGATLSGTVDIEGTALSNNFNYYKVEYSIDGANWISVVDDYAIETQVAEGVLASWDTTAVDNADYWLRAVVVDNTGNFVASSPVQVTVAN
ncbi:MAG: Ig-like domain-containing protein [Anaerolineae bacterium]|nr:Ig-like domain-containing protein [Anaerolineae bacterium]